MDAGGAIYRSDCCLSSARCSGCPNKLGYGLIPHIAQFDAVLAVQELEQLHNLGAAVDPAAQAAAGKLKALSVGINDASDTLMAKWKFFTLVLCMMLGTASLPHVLMRYFHHCVGQGCTSISWMVIGVYLPVVPNRTCFGDLY